MRFLTGFIQPMHKIYRSHCVDCRVIKNTKSALNKVTMKGKKKRLTIICKTECIFVSKKKRREPRWELRIGDNKIIQVPAFNSLGSVVTNGVKCDTEIRRSIEIVKVAF